MPHATHLILLGALSLALTAQPRQKIAPDFEALAPSDTVEMIVRFRSAPTSDSLHRMQRHGARHKGRLDLVRSSLVEAEVRNLGLIADDPEVEYVAPNRNVKATKADTPAFIGGPDYGWMTVLGISSSTASIPYHGSGIGVAILDSGIKDHEDVKDGIAAKNRVV